MPTICRLWTVLLAACIACAAVASTPAFAKPPTRKAKPAKDKVDGKEPAPSEAVVGKDLNVGVGLSAGNLLSGVSAKLYLDDDVALQMCLGAYVHSGFGVGLDGTLEARPRWAVLQNRLFWVGGIGVAGVSYTVATDSATLLAVSAIVEVGWQLQDLPLEFVLEARPYWVFGDKDAGAHPVSGGGSIRWYF